MVQSCTTTFNAPPFPLPASHEQTDTGSCRLSHLGATEIAGVQIINFATGTQAGTRTLTAANGDQVYTAHTGTSTSAQRRSAMLARYELSLMEFHRRYHRGLTLAIGLGIIRVQAAARYLRDSLRYRASRHGSRRAELAADLAAWRTVLASPRTRSADASA